MAGVGVDGDPLASAAWRAGRRAGAREGTTPSPVSPR
jgi:hypothetical protein